MLHHHRNWMMTLDQGLIRTPGLPLFWLVEALETIGRTFMNTPWWCKKLTLTLRNAYTEALIGSEKSFVFLNCGFA